MFHLDNAVLAWCRSIHPKGPEQEERISELSDHLHCEIQRLTGGGYSEEDAFVAATEAMGSVAELAQESFRCASPAERGRKVLLALGTCNVEYLARTLSAKGAGLLIIAVSLVFAGLMILSSILLGDSDWGNTLPMLLIAVWFVPYSTLTIASGRIEKGRCRQSA